MPEIRLDFKGLIVANTLAYSSGASVTKIKSFITSEQGGQPGLAGGAANALHVEPAAPPPPQPQQAVVGAGPFVAAGAGSPPLPPNVGAEAAQAVAVVAGPAPPPNLHFRPVVAAAGGVVSMSGQSALGRVPSPPPTDGATPIAENW
jgi:hypothetical protein